MAKNIKDTMNELSKVNVSIQRILADTMFEEYDDLCWKDWELESGDNSSSPKIKHTLLNFIPLLVKNRQRDYFL